MLEFRQKFCLSSVNNCVRQWLQLFDRFNDEQQDHRTWDFGFICSLSWLVGWLVGRSVAWLVCSLGFNSTFSITVCLFVCLVFNGTFSTNRLYGAIAVGK